MKKIPTVFVRDLQDRRYVTKAVTPGCEWVFTDSHQKVRATRKFDGTCMMLDEHGNWWARREVKPGKLIPDTFVLAEHDAITRKTVGWVPVAESSFPQLLPEALINGLPDGGVFAPGTYELCGPKINGNPEGLKAHILIPHGSVILNDAPRDFDGLAAYLGKQDPPIEGIVFWHEDGRMAKIKTKDFPS